MAASSGGASGKLDFTPLPLGRPGQDLGVSHMLKHYRALDEYWEDLAEDVFEDVRPLAIWRMVPTYDETSCGQTPDVTAHWEFMEAATEWGYLKLVLDRVRSLDAPPGTGWVRARNGRWKRHVGDGILLLARWSRRSRTLRMVSAYRWQLPPMLSYEHVPRSADQRARRAALQALRADQHIARKVAKQRQAASGSPGAGNSKWASSRQEP